MIELHRVQPSQLYLSQPKYEQHIALFATKGFDSCAPLPVKQIGADLFFTDGHTRAFILWQQGVQTVRVYHDPDDLNWVAYLENVQNCRNNDIFSIADLKNRLVNSETYEKRWLQHCAAVQAALRDDPLAALQLAFIDDPDDKAAICNEVLRALPAWFGIPAAIADYTATVRDFPFLTAALYGKVVGFCAVKPHFGINAELYVMGIFKEFHRLGIGARLIGGIDTYCRERGIPHMSVKTLSSSHPDPHYARTRRFYERMGFQPFEELPLWGEANPCLYMLRPVETPGSCHPQRAGGKPATRGN